MPQLLTKLVFNRSLCSKATFLVLALMPISISNRIFLIFFESDSLNYVLSITFLYITNKITFPFHLLLCGYDILIENCFNYRFVCKIVNYQTNILLSVSTIVEFVHERKQVDCSVCVCGERKKFSFMHHF